MKTTHISSQYAENNSYEILKKEKYLHFLVCLYSGIRWGGGVDGGVGRKKRNFQFSDPVISLSPVYLTPDNHDNRS